MLISNSDASSTRSAICLCYEFCQLDSLDVMCRTPPKIDELKCGVTDRIDLLGSDNQDFRYGRVGGKSLTILTSISYRYNCYVLITFCQQFARIAPRFASGESRWQN